MQNQTPLIDLPEEMPDFQTAMSELGRIPLILYQGLEQAASEAAGFRDANCPSERMDEGLTASLVRFRLQRYLKRVGVESQLEDELSIDPLPFMGISLHYGTYHVKVLKGASGCLPGCGDSEKKVRFYNQVQTMYLVDNRPMQTNANLIVLWDLDLSYALSGVWLALPAAGGARAGEVSAFWLERIPHPSEGLAGIAPQAPPPQDDLDGLVVPLEVDRRAVRSNER